MKPEEIAKLWMNENSIVNQKTVYFTAVNAALAAVCARLEDDLDYRRLLRFDFRPHERLPSNALLTFVPVLAVLVWFVLGLRTAWR